MIVRVAGIDPALKNMGLARMALDLNTMVLSVETLVLTQTEKRTGKQVRQNSDDLRRAQELHRAMIEGVRDCRVAFAEIPNGAQSARAAYSFGVAVGTIAACPIPVIQVQPFETKLATVGTKTASKEEMIEWATTTYPAAPWRRHGGRLKLDNEHLADACAIVHAGIRTDEFQRLLAMLPRTA